ncbi:hypothetical protein [Streptomyces californicus]|uniref:hypothetical protein n=1 Tax=Streptomyces californicus TaxID=67351 RepID=UPI00296EBEBA|nr:hypothetical protein [Streptomyces californicus]MDW4912449.1 hypothetical protein [Streptomyces californicus]
MTFYGIPPASIRRALAPDSGPDHARRIVGDAVAWWHDNRGGTSELPIAVGTLATLALAAPPTPAGRDFGPLLIPLNDAGITDALRAIWNTCWARNPVLTDTARPLHAWLAQPNDTDTRGLADYARVLIRAGLLEYASDVTRCEEEDVLGLMVQRMRSYSQRQPGGQFFTPATVANHMAGNLFTEPLPHGARLVEPCAGTGTMIRAAAATLRFQGTDPSVFQWWMNDIDPLLAGCLSVNAALWRLGPRVTVSCGDSLRSVQDLAESARQRAVAAIAEQKRTPILYPTSNWPSSHWPG